MSTKKQQRLNVDYASRKRRKTKAKDDVTQIQPEDTIATEKLLHSFDLNYAYGPCVGIKRIDRWERAQKLGLNPPAIIRDILKNDTHRIYQESLFNEFHFI